MQEPQQIAMSVNRYNRIAIKYYKDVHKFTQHGNKVLHVFKTRRDEY